MLGTCTLMILGLGIGVEEPIEAAQLVPVHHALCVVALWQAVVHIVSLHAAHPRAPLCAGRR